MWTSRVTRRVSIPYSVTPRPSSAPLLQWSDASNPDVCRQWRSPTRDGRMTSDPVTWGHHIRFAVTFIVVTACCQVSLHLVAEVRRSAILVQEESSRIFRKLRHKPVNQDVEMFPATVCSPKWTGTKRVAFCAVPSMFDDLMRIYRTPDTNVVEADFAAKWKVTLSLKTRHPFWASLEGHSRNPSACVVVWLKAVSAVAFKLPWASACGECARLMFVASSTRGYICKWTS
jgi:hypothetical protein